jgi:colicin import membrane protein
MVRNISDSSFYGLAFFCALALHAGALALLSVNYENPSITISDRQDYYIQAELYFDSPVSEPEGLSTSNANEIDRIIEARRLEEGIIKSRVNNWQKTNASEEVKKIDQERKKDLSKLKESGKKKGIGHREDPVSVDFSSDLDRAILKEERLWKAKTEKEKVLAHVAIIQQEIIRNWSRPPSARNGMTCLLRVLLLPTGEVMQAKIEESSGNDAFDRSATRAVLLAGNLSVPRDNLLFERNFREFTLLFRPDDLRL